MSKLQTENKRLKAEITRLKKKLEDATGPSWEKKLKALVSTKPEEVEEFIRGTYGADPDYTNRSQLFEVAQRRAVAVGAETFIDQLTTYIG